MKSRYSDMKIVRRYSPALMSNRFLQTSATFCMIRTQEWPYYYAQSPAVLVGRAPVLQRTVQAAP